MSSSSSHVSYDQLDKSEDPRWKKRKRMCIYMYGCQAVHEGSDQDFERISSREAEYTIVMICRLFSFIRVFFCTIHTGAATLFNELVKLLSFVECFMMWDETDRLYFDCTTLNMCTFTADKHKNLTHFWHSNLPASAALLTDKDNISCKSCSYFFSSSSQ